VKKLLPLFLTRILALDLCLNLLGFVLHIFVDFKRFKPETTTMSRRMTRATADSMASSSTQLSSSNYIAPSTLMYINSQCNHPAFNKLYLGPNLSQNGKLIGGASAVPKPPKPPEKPLMPYLRYSKKVWDDVKASEPELRLSQIGKMIGRMWHELPSTDKQIYVDEYESEKAEYQKLLKLYHNSPAYQGYLQAKGRAEAIELENKASERDDSIMSIEPADDGSGDTDEGFSVKHVSAARFQRNHRLMQNILLDTTPVPSSHGIVTEQRLDILQNQVQSLDRHQRKLETELVEIEKNHTETKRKWQESTNNFMIELKRLRNLTPQEYYAQCKKKQTLKNQAQGEAENAHKAPEKEIKPDAAEVSTASNDATEASGSKQPTTEDPGMDGVKNDSSECQVGSSNDESASKQPEHENIKSEKNSSGVTETQMDTNQEVAAQKSIVDAQVDVPMKDESTTAEKSDEHEVKE